VTARFDYYAASLDVPPGVIADAILEKVPGASSVRLGRGKNGYKSSMSVTDGGDDVMATILYGGYNLMPHAFASGKDAPMFARVMRDHWGDAHRVTRVDSCCDVYEDFHKAHPALQQMARARGLRGRSILPDDPQDGSSYYIGSPSSRVQVRIYEKGLEMRAKGHDVPDEYLGALRFEVQLRPTKEGRVTASAMTPDEVWGATPWTRDIAVKHLGYDPGRNPARFKLHTTFERRSQVIIDQHGHHLFRWARQLGGWQQLGDEIERGIGIQ
jgi:hypothetical protein